MFWFGFLVGCLCLICAIVGYLAASQLRGQTEIINPLARPKEYPLNRYRIADLRTRSPQGVDLKLGDIEATGSGYMVYRFHFLTEGTFASGLAHVPDQCSKDSKCPVIVQLRGFIDKERYYPGAGTAPSARKFAEAGFVSLAPDYLGFGSSASPSADVFEERFQKYTTTLDLLSLIKEFPFIDDTKVGLWGHSNGGQVTLTVLEATGKNFPTVLWAPVSAPFPYSILYFSDEDMDFGQSMRKELARFESDYDANQFTVVPFLNLIQAPIQLHQGGLDDQVPPKWSRSLVKRMKEMDKEIEYFEYPQADHNLRPDWNTAVSRTIQFFKDHLLTQQ